jgi:hypothetical protein
MNRSPSTSPRRDPWPSRHPAGTASFVLAARHLRTYGRRRCVAPRLGMLCMCWDELHHSRGADASESCETSVPPESRGRREGRVSATPAAPVHNKKHGEGTTGEDGTIRPSLRDGFTTYNALSLGTGLSCPHRRTKPWLRTTWSQRRETRTTRLCRTRGCCSSGNIIASTASPAQRS